MFLLFSLFVRRMPTKKQDQASPYLLAMTRFLTDIMETTLLGLPNDIKGLVYFDALSHLASEILVSYYSSPLLRSFVLLLASRLSTRRRDRSGHADEEASLSPSSIRIATRFASSMKRSLSSRHAINPTRLASSHLTN